jgi:uncharacterized membrane protein YedE/YeeE
MPALITFPIGLLFGLGLVLSGMINPEKVIGFLDLTGNFDPSLAFVMGGALAVTIPGYHLLFKRQAPLMAPKFDLPTKTRIDSQLVTGALIFGVGWGLAGLCPGPAISALGSGRLEAFVFVIP